MSKQITVFGSTGSQGGSVVRALAGKYAVRAITRNVESEKAKKLAAIGVEVVRASMDEADTLDSAVAGSYGVFVVTNFWEHFDKDREIRQAKNVLDACKKAGVKHVVYSGLEKVVEITGKSCPHFDGKGEIEQYIQAIGLPNTIVRYPYYYENLLTALGFGGFQQGDNSDEYTVTSCMEGKMDAVSVHSAGPAIASIFAQPGKYIGKTIGLSGDKLTVEEYFRIISDATGKKIIVKTISIEEYEKLPFPGAKDLAAMFHFYIKGNPQRDIKLTKELDPTTPSFKTWAMNNKNSFAFE